MKSMNEKPKIKTSAFKKAAVASVKWNKKAATKSIRRGKSVVDDLQEQLGRKRFFMILGALGIVILLVIIVTIIVAATKKRGSEATDPPEKFNDTSSTMFTTGMQFTTASIYASGSTSSQSEVLNNTTRTFHTRTTTKLPISTRMSTPTTSTTKSPTAKIHCMIVGDLFNLGNDTTISPTKYEDERWMVDRAGELLFEGQENTVGIWAYGHVTHHKNFQNMFKLATTWTEFSETLRQMMTYESEKLFPVAGPPTDYNVGIFMAINATGDPDDTANCLVFLSAMSNAIGFKIAPDYNYTRIVVVNLAEGDFGSIVDKPRGEVVKVTRPYDLEANAVKIHEAILRGFQM